MMNRPLNILTLTTLFPNAASSNFGIFVERQTTELASRADANVTVINPIGIPPWPLSRHTRYKLLTELPRHEQWRGLNTYRPRFTLIPKMGGPSNPKHIVSAILPLVRELHGKRAFDLIDAEFFYPDGPAAMQIADAIDVPFTVKARGSDIHVWAKNPKCQPQILETADKAARLFAVSEALKQDMVALGIDESKISVHYTGLDQRKFKPINRDAAKQKLGVNGLLLISVGTLTARKNQALVIEALTDLPDATLLIAGKGEAEDSYRSLAKKLGVADRVRFQGNVAHDDMPKLVAAADIAVLASQSEGLANAWVEALACGTPIIISEAGGARELVKSDVAGRIVDQNSAAITKAIQAILTNPPTQQDVRATVSEFSWKNNGDQLLGHFRSIAARNRLGD